jgi:hypothetical protein
MVDVQDGQENVYHIRVQGILDKRWADWFDGFVMTSRESGESLLSGAVTDQAALHGALGKIRGLDLPLLLAVQTECPCSNDHCQRRGRCQECAAYYSSKGKLPYCFRGNTEWERQCAAVTTVKGEAEMDGNTQKIPRCADCALRKRAEATPESLLGRLWYWHIGWCPGWKTFQAYLAGREA